MTRQQQRDRLRAELVRAFHASKPDITIADLAARYGCGPSTARRLLEEAGVKSRPHLLGLTDDEVSAELVTRYYDLGIPKLTLTTVTGIDHRLIRRCLREAGLERPRRRLAMPVDDIVDAYHAGASIRELAERAGTYGTVRLALLDAGVELRGRGGPRRAAVRNSVRRRGDGPLTRTEAAEGTGATT